MHHFEQTIVKTYCIKFQIFTEYLHTFVNSRKIRFSCSEKRRYPLKRKLDEYDRPSSVAEEHGAEALIPVKTPPAQTTQWSMNKSF